MNVRNKKLKNQKKMDIRPIVSIFILLAFLSTILVVTLIELSKGRQEPTENHLSTENNENKEGDQKIAGRTLLAVIKEVNIEDQSMVLFDVEEEVENVLYYSGKTQITDKYGQIISAKQLILGSMVDVEVQSEKQEISSISTSTRAWEYVGVSNLTINQNQNSMKIASKKYRYYDNIHVLDDKNWIAVEDLREQDEFTIWGTNEVIWSIIITRGHGAVKIEDYEPYLGNFITIGYESMEQIVESMDEIIVREGTFDLVIENESYSGTKEITVERNHITTVSLKDFGPDGLKKGQVSFEITPFGADLYINGKLRSYGNPIPLTYGTYKMELSLGGYETYRGTLVVNETKKVVKIDLPEIEVQEESEEPDSIEEEPIEASDRDPSENEHTELVYIQSPIGASIYLDGEYKGLSPISFEKTTGTQVLTLIKEGFTTVSYTIDIKDDGENVYLSYPELLPLP